MFNFFNSNKGYENINSQKFNELMDSNKDAVILDVRTSGEFRQGAIPGAKNIDIMSPNFQHQVAALDKTKTYLVYCRSGNRSGQACQIMSGAGFTSLYNLSGGVMSYTR
jgi:rhodanese-related sulfurtransferase